MTGVVKARLVFFVLTVFAISIFIAGCDYNVLDGAFGKTDKPVSLQGTQDSEKTVLTFWSWAAKADTIEAVYEDAIKNFNANNKFNVEIKASYTPGEQYKNKLQTEMAANNAPDMFNMWAAGKMKPYVDAKRLYPIGDLIDQDPEWRDRYEDGVFDLTTFGGKIYGVPQFRVACLVYYNKDMFSKYGINNVPSTWSELLNVIQVLKRNGKDAFALDLKEPWVGALYAEYIADRIDPEAYRKVQKDPDWLIPVYIETGKRIQELVKAGAFPKGANTLDYAAARNLFDEEKAGMYLMGNWDVGYLSKDSPIKDKIGVFKFPAIEGGKGNADSWLAGVEAVIAVSANCRMPEACAEFLKYMASDEIAKNKIVEEAEYVSAVKVTPEPTKITRLYSEVSDLLKDEKSTFPFYDVNLGYIVGDDFNSTIQSIFIGKSPEQAFKKLGEVAKDEMTVSK